MLYLIIVMVWSGLISAAVRKWMWGSMLIVVLCSGVYVGSGFYKDSLASIEDAEREKMLWKYEPFSEDMIEVMPPRRSKELQLTKALLP